MTSYWLNVDIPTKNGRLHRESCKWAKGKYETALKGIGELRQDGGWLEFSSAEDAEGYFHANFGRKPGFQFAFCKRCF